MRYSRSLLNYENNEKSLKGKGEQGMVKELSNARRPRILGSTFHIKYTNLNLLSWYKGCVLERNRRRGYIGYRIGIGYRQVLFLV